MADGVVIKIDGDDSGFREKILGAASAAESALAGVERVAADAGSSIEAIGDKAQNALGSIETLMERLGVMKRPLGGEETLYAARDALDGVYGSLDSKTGGGDGAQKGVSRDFAGGVDSGAAKASAQSLAAAVAGELSNAAALAKQAGANVGQGFADGISGKLGAVIAKAAALARAAISAIDGAVENASPSKKARKSGAFVAEGFSMGMANGVERAKSAGRYVGSAGLAGLDAGGAWAAGMYSASGRAGDIDYERLADAAANRPVDLYVNSRAFARAVAGDASNAIDARKSALYKGRGR